MKGYNTWMVALDFTSMDDTLLAYTKFLSGVLKPNMIYFSHVNRGLKMPDSVHIHMTDLKRPDNSELQAKLEVKVGEYFESEKEVEIDCMVFDGKPKFELWRDTYAFDVDLFIAGGKKKHHGRGIIPKKFVRKSFCSVLFVPEEFPGKIENILVPVDFSEASKKVLERAINLAKSVKNCTITCLYVFDSPYSWDFVTLPFKEYIKLFKEEASKNYNDFMDGIDDNGVEIKGRLVLRELPHIANHIKEIAEDENTDLIMMSASGKSTFSAIVLGSETEKLVQVEKDFPVMIGKEKSDMVKYWDLVSTF